MDQWFDPWSRSDGTELISHELLSKVMFPLTFTRTHINKNTVDESWESEQIMPTYFFFKKKEGATQKTTHDINKRSMKNDAFLQNEK